jgi:hypothetical protein
LTIISSTLVFLSWFPAATKPRATVIICLLSLVLFGIVIAAVVFELSSIAQLANVANHILPPGWVLLMANNMLAKIPDPNYWLFALPVLAMIITGFTSRDRFISRYQIIDLTPQSDGTMQATDADKITVTLTDDFEEIKEVDRQSARELVHNEIHEFQYEFENSGWFESKLWSLLNSEERASLFAVLPFIPAWTAQWIRMCICIGVALIGMSVISFFVHADVVTFASYGLLTIALLFVAATTYGFIWHSPGSLTSCTSAILLPTSDRHLNRIFMTIGTMRAISIFPVVYLAGLVIALANREFDLLASLVFAAKGSLLFLACHQWWFKLLQPHDISQGSTRTFFVALLAICAFGGIVLLFLEDESHLLTMFGTLLLFGSGHLAYLSFRYGKLNDPMDFICAALDDDV